MFRFFKEKYPVFSCPSQLLPGESFRRVSKQFYVVAVICFGFNLSSQVFYSTDPHYLKSKTESNNLLSGYINSYPDTSITELSNYFPRNYLGNLGLSSPNYLFKYGTDDIGFRFYNRPLDIDQVKEKQVEYYRSKGPYANLTGVAGSKELQIFKMLFTHTYKDKVNVTVRFNRYTSKGFYKNQQTYTNNFFLSSNFSNKKKRLGYYFFILNNGNKNQENGGIRVDSLNDSTMLIGKDLLSVKTTGANRDNRETSVMLNPWFRLNKRSDSVHTVNHYVQLKSRFSDNSYRFTDLRIAEDKFYSVAYLDTTKTMDSSHVRKYTNELSYSLFDMHEHFGASIGYKNEINQVHQHQDSLFTNHLFQGDFFINKFFKPKDSLDKTERSFESRLNIQYVMMGTNGGNYKAESNTVFILNGIKKSRVFLNVLYEKRSPDYIYNYWVSNHFLWLNNGFGTQEQLQAQFGCKLRSYFTAYIFNQMVSNYLYFNQSALPAQYAPTIQNLGFDLNFTKVLFKHLGLSLNYRYQNTSQAKIIRVPQNIYTAKLFYHGNLFKNNLQLQIGSQLQMYDAFYSYNYMPATQVFYLQDKFQTAPYPYVDVYLNARIRPVAFFVKVENAIQGLAGPNYSFVPGYYQPDRAFRFGISWSFFD
jgi:hypothetical protein